MNAKIKKIISLLLIFVLLTGTVSCAKKGKLVYSEESSQAKLPDDKIYGEPDWIVKATVEEIANEYFTNPDQTKKAEDGTLYTNAHVTVYTLRISEIYKGTLAENTLELKLLNGKGMSPELYLYGEDDSYVRDSSYESFLLDVGEEYILGIVHQDAGVSRYESDAGNLLRYGDTWCFSETGDGVYENKDNGINHITFTEEELKEKIAAVTALS